MVCEGIIALIWAAASIALFDIADGKMTGLKEAMAAGQSACVYNVCMTTMGKVGAVLAMLGVFACLLVGFYITIAKGKPIYMGFATSACIGFSLLFTMIISSALGSLIPMGFKRIGIDPAVASGPLITTINDMIAVITYYGLSWIFLINLFQFAG